MGWLEFITRETSSLASLAWPGVALAAVLLLKSEIKTAARALAERFKELVSMKTPVGEVTFAQKPIALEEKVAESLELEIPAIESASESRDADVAAESEQTDVASQKVVFVTRALPNYAELAKTNQAHAMKLAFQDFEFLLRQQFFQQYPTLPADLSFNQMIDTLKVDGTFPPEMSSDLVDLLRSIAEVGESSVQLNTALDQKSADAYIDNVNQIVDLLNRLKFFKEPIR